MALLRQLYRNFIFQALVAMMIVAILATWLGAWSPSDPASPIGGAVDQVRHLGCGVDPADLPAVQGPDGQPANYLHTCGNRLYDSTGKEVRLTGVNWFGMETGTFSPHGLWSRNWKGILDQIASLGYNSIRLPYSNELFEPGSLPQDINYDLNPDLRGLTGLEIMDQVVAGARERGLKIVLDRHRPTSEAQSDLWYTKEVPEDRWIADWRMLAGRYKGNDAVVGVDLHNEPRGAATWGTGDMATDWRLAAQRAATAIQEVNPYLLIFVQGVERQGNDWYWWGGNLKGAAANPVEVRIPARVVYTPHDYGPSVFQQGWFSDPSFPRNLPSVWDSHWGYLAQGNTAPIVLGEFGARSAGNDADGEWQRTLVKYLKDRQMGFFVWSLNPNSGDTGGILGDDWLTIVKDRQALYQSALAPMISPSRLLSSPPTGTSPVHLLYHPKETSLSTNNITFEIQIANDTSGPIDWKNLEVRYWFQAEGGPTDGTPQVNVDWAAIGEKYVKGEFVKTSQGGQNRYLRVTFDPKAGQLQPYVSSGTILLRIHKADWSAYDQSNDYSFSSSITDFTKWDHITVYLNGKLVWGKEP